MPVNQPSPASLPLIVYICSAARCGSTLTDMFIGGHPDVASLGELNFLGKAIAMGEDCSCGARVRDCSSWGEVFAELRRQKGIDPLTHPYLFNLWDARAYNLIDHTRQTRTWLIGMRLRRIWMEAREHLPPPLRDACPIPPSLAASLQHKVWLLQTISALWGKCVVVDSSKNAIEAVQLYLRHPDRVRLVLLTRDGRGVYLSRRSSGFGRRESVRGWLNYYRRFVPLIERHVQKDHVFRLRYEDFANAPADYGRRLCEFIGVKFKPDMLDLGGAVRHMVNGNDTRFAPKKGIQLDERWRRELVGEELEYFERMGGAMNRRLGYV